ncbi:DUF3108 domain-containing protein [Paracidovorax sp. MALMAid1276]|uniref:DUF3108 domain-containing protein n=1 Tax=Paracidovorax sp. MALMAid1276 TaxID=3411631 RepID=UPI003B9A8DF6
MPRRALALITTLVLALHWLVLHGVPLQWDHPAPPSGQVFSTRSIAAPPPAPWLPAAQAATPTAVPAKPRAAPKPRARPTTAPPVAAPAEAPPAQDGPGTGSDASANAAPAAPTPDLAATEGAEVADAGPPTEALPAAADAAQAAAAPASLPASLPASSPATAQASGPRPEATSGVDITPPGAGTGTQPSTTPPPVRLPPPTRLAFDVSGQAKKFTYHARAELLWQHDGSRYQARQELSAFLLGSRAQNSTGQITAHGLLPERFSDRARSEQAAHFDYAKGRIIFSANTPEAPVGPGAQDRLSVFIQLGAMLAADPARFVPGTQLTLTTVSARSAERWTFTVEGPDTLDLPSGPTPTLKLQRLPRKEYDQKAELWLAPSLGYLPVRIRLTQANGDFADLQLRGSSPP